MAGALAAPHTRSLRRRLLLAFGLVAVPPLLVLSIVGSALVQRALMRSTTRALDVSVGAIRGHLDRLKARAGDQVLSIARDELSESVRGSAGETNSVHVIAQRHDLPLLSIVDEHGVVVASHQWPAGEGLPESGRSLDANGTLRLEPVAAGYGSTERLAFMASAKAEWRHVPVTVRGGFFLDRDLLEEAATLSGAAIGFWDAAGGRWIAASDPMLSSSTATPSRLTDRHGELWSNGTRFRWSAAPMPGSSVWLVAARPVGDAEILVHTLRQTTLALAAIALLAAVVTAAAISARLARPVRALADAAQRVADGNFDVHVEPRSGDELGELTRRFNTMTRELRDSRERLVQAERVAAWREIARRVAHELKNPLFPIQLSIETLRRSHAHTAAFDALFQQSTQTILDELRALLRVIDSFSRLALLPQPRLERLSVNDLVNQTLALYAPSGGKIGIEVQLGDSLPSIAGDAELLKRALDNLVKNAIEAAPDGGRVCVRTRRDGGRVRIDVEDDGAGLTDEQRARLFVPYATTKPGGTGLGLVIVQGIVSDHRGQIQVRTAPGQGTTFSILLPRA